MDYYIRCGDVIIFRNQYVLMCNKCKTLFLALESFISHYDSNHRRSDGYVSPCSKVYINLTEKNDSFDSYEYDHDNSLIENRYETTNTAAKAEEIHPNDTVPRNSFLDDSQTPYKNTNRLPKNDLPTSQKKTKKYSTRSNEVPVDVDDSDSLSSSHNAKRRTCYLAPESWTVLNPVRRRRSAKRYRWGEEEKKAIFKYFGPLKKLERLPTIQQCADVITVYPVLSHRTAPQIKTWIDNQRRCRRK